MFVIPDGHVNCCFDIHYSVEGAKGGRLEGITQQKIKDETSMYKFKYPT